jgi:iturin family lipopeptide synthetase A
MSNYKEPIAITGIGCRFPGAKNPQAFWQLLTNSVDAIAEVPASRWDIEAFYDQDTNQQDKMNTRWGGFLDQVDEFDPQFFGISPREAASMDPQQRLLLEVAWEALEDANIVPDSISGSAVGVFVGISSYDYYELLTKTAVNIDAYAATGNNNCMAAHRLSYVFNLTGPSMAIDTACSSSLVAVHLACQSIWNGECKQALVGGVHVMLSPWVTVSFAKGGFMAPDGRCKPFDAAANGYVRGEGAGMVVLKPLSQALADGDSIYAVVQGSAVNQDGRSNGLTAPNPRAQEALLREAYQMAGISPSAVQYIEAHGTGTSLGDPMEMKALGKVLAEGRDKDNYCAVGSVKSNIGHLEAAAGIAGLIKVALCLKHQQIPATLHFHKPNPYIPFDKLPLRVQQTLGEWTDASRIAGVSSFGFGGTNAHVVLASAPKSEFKVKDIERPLHLLTLSAKTPQALQQLAFSYQEHLSNIPDAIEDICFSANTGRSHLTHRLATVVESTEQLQKALLSYTQGEEIPNVVSGSLKRNQRPKVAFLFAGQGSQYINMGLRLYEQSPIFRSSIDRCDEILRPFLPQPLLSVLYAEAANPELDETGYTQPALFALEYALFQLWQSWGIKPDAVIGHSLGEYVAACVAGVFSLEEGLTLVAQRSRLMQSLPANGKMAVVFTNQEQVLDTIAPYQGQVVIAAVNGADNIVISGEVEAVAQALSKFESQGITTKLLQVSHAFHSPLMDSILPEFAAIANQVQFKAPRIPLVSNVTGLIASTVMDANYWCRHLRESVQFAQGIQTLAEQNYTIFIELGPHSTLLGMGKRCLPSQIGCWLPSLLRGQDDWQVILNSLAVLETQGVNIDWNRFDRDYSRRQVQLPTYPFERKRYWIESEQKPEQKPPQKSQQKEVKMMNVTEAKTLAKTSHINTIQTKLTALIASLLRIEVSNLDIQVPFLEMGADSIVLVEAVRTIENTFGVKIAIRQLFEEFSTIAALAAYIDSKSSPEQFVSEAQPQQQEVVTSEEINSNGTNHQELIAKDFGTSNQLANLTQVKYLENRNYSTPALTSELQQIINHQLEIMSQQLQVLGSNGMLAHTLPVGDITQSNQNGVANKQLNGQVNLPKKPGNRKLTSTQQSYVDAFFARYTKQTKTSKQKVETERPVFADTRAGASFRADIKEIYYPIIGEKSSGSRIWDVDGNEYIDLTMGFGVNLLGHNVPFITSALTAQCQKGIQIGPRSQLGGEVAKLITELTGVERVTFCNSGTEAVMTALRVARAVTRRNKVVMFTGSYHGHFDGTLATSSGDGKSLPLAPGVAENMVEDVLVLTYGDMRSLDIIKANAQEIGAVLVEPIQSRRPDLQPKAFVQELRKLTAQTGIALIFDEVLIGFRVLPGGAQAWYGVEADLVTYGKIVGGGLPIGVLAGKAAYMNAIDGGMWNFGDNSYPQAETTYFAGTFSKHPLTMVAAHAMLSHLQQEGATLQQGLNQRTEMLATSLNSYFQENNLPIRMVYFSSLFRFVYAENYSLFNQPLEMELLYYHLIQKGVYIWEGRSCFLSTAHTDDEIKYIIQAVKDSIQEMQTVGFFSQVNKPELQKVNSPQLHKLPAAIKQIAQTAVTNTTSVFEAAKSHQPTLPIQSSQHQVAATRQEISFGIYYFGAYKSDFDPNKYSLLFKGAKFADENNFSAIWIPERHFHSFGGFSPNPSVIAAALAMETKQIQLRAGSVVLPLHHPIRVAEEWSVVDNLSKGRVGIAFASGWHANDFALAPQNFGKHREILFKEIETVKKLWRGESIEVRDGAGSDINVKLFPMPMQAELSTWITVVNNPDTYIKAGEIGAGVLTNLMGQTIDDLANNIQLYRQALSKNGHDPNSAKVTVLLHTFLGTDVNNAREIARQPFYNYLRSTVGLFQNLAKSQGLKVDINNLAEDDVNYILSKTYDRYVETSALIGTPESCLPIVENLKAIGVDEIACFIDFGVDEDAVFESFSYLNDLKNRYQTPNDSSTSEILPAIPLMPAQQQLWLLAQMGDNVSSAYNESLMLKLRGSLNFDALQTAFETVVERHEALRTVISYKGDVQYILPSLKVDIAVTDFSNLDPSVAEIEVANYLKQASQASFNLEEGPLFRVNLVKLEPQTHLLWFTAHHIIIDGWSIGSLLQEITTLYSAECQLTGCELQPTLQFRDYINWLDQQSLNPEMGGHQAYWLKQFSDTIPILDLPCDRPRPSIKTYNGARASLKLETNIYNQLKKLSSRNGCTLFMTLLSIYTLLLHRLTNQDDIVIGVPVAQRKLEGAEKILGYCADLLPIRSHLIGSPAFSEYLSTIRNVVLDAYEHQDYTFSRLLYQLNVERDTSRSPLVNASFNFDRPRAIPQMSGLELELVSPPVSYTKFDIHLNAIEAQDALLLEIDYNTDLFDDSTINRWLSGLQNWIESIVNQDLSVNNLPLLNETQHYQQLFALNDSQTDFPDDKCIHQLFEEQVAKTPDATAVTFENESLTYSQLNKRANHVAHYLRSLSIKPGVLVGLCCDRSLEMMVGMLGILKSGAAYVPFDPTYPQEHQSFMLQDADVPILLTQQHLLTNLPQNQAQVICLDTDWAKIASSSEENPNTQMTASDLAYVIYTSGSTGKPKGVAIAHRGVCNQLYWRKTTFGLTSTDKVLQTFSISFDPSVWQIFLPLLFGGELVIARPGGHMDADYIVQLIIQQQVTIITLVPSMLRVFLDAKGVENCTCLKHVTCGGEALPVELIERFYERLNVGDILHNLYGPTEATIDATYWTCQRGTDYSIAPIGRAIANTQTYILNLDLQPVATGEPGELYIGGVGLAKGYLNRPELTAERFIPNPFSQDPESRLYKTGDSARYLSDGNIEFLCRLDQQVKIRGFRIELGEIETILSQHPDVKQAVVIAREDVPGNKRLVSYIVLKSATNAAELREYLKQKLPEYKVPSAYVVLDKIPLTPNGKVNRHELPVPEISQEMSANFVMPRNEIEKRIAKICQKALNLEKVGIYDNFFELGGNSLLLVEVHRELQEMFGDKLSILDMFKYPSVYGLAQYLNQQPSPDSSKQKLVQRGSERQAAMKLQQQLRHNRK